MTLPSLVEMGIGRKQIQFAINQLKCDVLSATHTTPSHTTYVRCLIDDTLWDLKPTVGLALENAVLNIPPRDWQTPTFRNDLLNLGFPILRFHNRDKRQLGINNYDLAELDAPHTVYWPNGQEEINGFIPRQTTNEPERTIGLTSRIIRNSEYIKTIKRRAGGKCDACNQQTFQTPTGEWFIEVHHKRWLSEGGLDEMENMVALCPTCHRQEHHGRQRKYR